MRAFRDHYRISLKELAGAIGINFGTLSRYERGERTVPTATASAVIAYWVARTQGT